MMCMYGLMDRRWNPSHWSPRARKLLTQSFTCNVLSTVYTCTCKPLICSILLISYKHICNHLSPVCPCHLSTCWWKPSLSVSDGFHLETIACKEAKSCMEGKYKSHKKVCQTQTSTCRDEILKNQPNKTGTTPQYFYTIPTSCAIFPKLCVCICFLVVCRRGLSCRWKGVAWVCCA